MSEVAVRCDGLGKQYRRGLHLEPYKTARETIVRAAKAPFRGGNGKRDDDRWFWALEDISFELSEGEAMGVIGRNGAGKTTLLKVLSRITRPTAGHALVAGRVGVLLEVGAAFHPELTGAENIKLNAAILGMSRAEIARRFDEIVEFAEVEKFIDTPVKRYSSGMFVRLAFSVAAHLEPDILVVDEVLAVGDAAFQRKCLGKLDEVGTEGRTVIFVSHNMASVSQLCNRGMLLETGRIEKQGDIEDVIDTYLRSVASNKGEVTFENDPSKGATIVRLAAVTETLSAAPRFESTKPIVLETELQVNRPLTGDRVWLALYQADRLMVLKASDDDSGPAPQSREPGRYAVRFTIPPNVLNEGAYQFRSVIGKRHGVHHDDQESAYFEVEDTNDYRSSDMGKRQGVVRMNLASEEERIG